MLFFLLCDGARQVRVLCIPPLQWCSEPSGHYEPRESLWWSLEFGMSSDGSEMPPLMKSMDRTRVRGPLIPLLAKRRGVHGGARCERHLGFVQRTVADVAETKAGQGLLSSKHQPECGCEFGSMSATNNRQHAFVSVAQTGRAPVRKDGRMRVRIPSETPVKWFHRAKTSAQRTQKVCLGITANSSIGQSPRLITGLFRVRIPICRQ